MEFDCIYWDLMISLMTTWGMNETNVYNEMMMAMNDNRDEN